jgi:hypothetical protein
MSSPARSGAALREDRALGEGRWSAVNVSGYKSFAGIVLG